MAYARLGAIYSNLGQVDLAEDNRKKAFDLKDRASERGAALYHGTLLHG